MSTYVKFFRALADHQLLANDNNAYIVFTKVLLKADWKTGVYRTGRKKLGLLANLKDTTAWGALKRLENDGAVTLVTTGRFTDIHICNWWKYQGETEKSNDRSATRNEQLNDTKQEQKNKEIIYTGDEKLLLETVNKIIGRKFERLTYTAKASLKTFGVPQIEVALKNLIMDDWHTTDKLQSAGMDYLLRSHTLRRFLPSDKPKITKPSIQIGGSAARRPTDERLNLSRAELQKLE